MIERGPAKRSRLKRRRVTDPRAAARLGDGANEATLAARVSKGTYIRCLARDIAHALGTRRPRHHVAADQAGPFTLEQAISLDKLAETAKAPHP